MIDTSANLNRVERGSGNTILADAGATLARQRICLQIGADGLEFAHGIPGTVGGGVWRTPGLRRRDEAGASIRGGAVPRSEGIRTLSCEELNLSYRHSLLTEHPRRWCCTRI